MRKWLLLQMPAFQRKALSIMFIDLLRHGEVQGKNTFRGHTDEPLTQHGWQQMASSLDNYQTETVIYSPLKRCAEFAITWANQQNIHSLAMPEFMEMNFGDWDGLTAEEVQLTHKKELDNFWQNPVDNPPPNGENLLNFKDRVINGLNALIENHKDLDEDQNILLITHAGDIRMILAHVLSIPMEKLLTIECPLASMSRIRISFDDDNNQYRSLVFHGGKA